MDYISSLPDSVTQSILERLPLREAVRSSILSREWRYKWTSVPMLVFNFMANPFLLSEDSVGDILRQHRGPLSRILFRCASSEEDINRWIPLIESGPVQDFTLIIFLGNRYNLPRHFFTFENLKHLHLSRCAFNPPQEFGGFRKLVTLDFEDVVYAPLIVQQLISRNPLLESLRLIGCSELDTFEIQGPSLRSFHFRGGFNTMTFINSPLLAEVSLSTAVVRNLGLQPSPNRTHFQVLPTVEKLNLHASILALLDEGAGAGAGNNIPRRLPYRFDRIKRLDLSMFLSSIEEAASVLCLLHTLENISRVIQFMRAQERPDRDLRQLRRVELKLFSFKTEIVVLSYLLASAAGLQEMVITTEYFSRSEENKILNQLTELHRASRNVRVSVIIRGEEHFVLQRSASRRRPESASSSNSQIPPM